MRLWILSDLHLELTRDWELPPLAERPDFDVLVMAGDLIPRMERGVRWLRERVSDRPVIYIPGNHEAYGTDIDRTVAKAREAAAGSNVHVLQDDTVVTGGVVRFIGCTLWTDFALFGDAKTAIRVAHADMNDYRKIRTLDHTRRFTPANSLARHLRSRAVIREQLSSPFPGRTVMVTHHGPHREAIRRGFEEDPIAATYTSDLAQMIIELEPELWIYGHTHESDDRLIGRTRIVANAKGYGPWDRMPTWDNNLFNPKLVIDV